MTNEEINNSERTEGESQGVNIYEEIKKEIQRVIDSENPNDKGQDNEDLYESIWDKNYYESQSEGKE